MKTKNCLYKFLMSLLIITLAVPFMNIKVFSAPPGSFIEFTSDGSLRVEVTTTAATTGIRYRTVGWMITTVPTCSGGDCKPKNYPHVEFQNARDALESSTPNPPIPGQPVKTTWFFPAEIVEEEFFSIFEDILQPGQKLYFSAVMESFNSSNGTKRSGPHYTLNGIKGAEGWANPGDLNAYFDIDVSYNPMQPVHEKLVFIDSDGTKTEHSSRLIDRVPLSSDFSHTLPETITLSDGKKAKIVKSFYTRVRKPTEERAPRVTGDSTLRTRNIKPGIGGSIIVGEYSLAEASVKAKFIRQDDKSELKAPEDLGNHAPGTAFSYDFKPNEFIEKYANGHMQKFQLVKTYILKGDSPTQHSPQEKTDPSLFKRNITVDPTGSTFVGEYKMVQNPVEAISLTESGTTLKTVDLGDHAVGAEITHTFDQTIPSGGITYEIIQSYIVNNSNPSQKNFIQNEGDPKLRTRNFNVGIGGTKVYAIYRDPGNPGGGGDPGGGDPGNPGGGSCSPSIGSPSKGTVTSQTIMDPGANGVIGADSRGAEKFNVRDGIPTSESLYVNVFGLNYLYQNKWANMTGKVTYKVPVKKTYLLQWTEPGEEGPDGSEGEPQPQEDTEVVEEIITVERDYSYWQIDNLEVYRLTNTTISNYALPNGSVTINAGSGYTPPTLESSNSDSVTNHVQPFDCQAQDLGQVTISGGDRRPTVPDEKSLFTSQAESHVGQNKVKNDKVVFNSTTIMSDAWTDKTAPTPGQIPTPTVISNNVLYGSNYMISNTLLNRANNPTTGTINYDLIPGNIKGGSNKNFSVNGINNVTVHTPTVNFSNASDDTTHNQKTVPNYSRKAFILDRPFTVTIPTSGQHRNIQGYGNRDYAKYIKLKQVQFEFDVYSANMSNFYPANTWIDIPVSQIETTFYLPKWVDEGNYTVYYRSFAENSPNSGFSTEQDANLDLANHVATDTVPVEVIGRIYDFRITDIADPNWETVFRTAKGSSTPRGTSYWVGPNGIDGAPNGSAYPYQLPIRRGSHPLANYKSVAVKTGYHFKFDLKTKGNMFGDKDAVRITPKFYFQDNDPSTPAKRIEVDLYYHSDTKKFVRIGSTADVERRELILNNRLRNVPYNEIVNTAGSIYDLNTGWTMTRDQYINRFVKRTTEPTYVGGYDVQILPSPLRTFINTYDRPNNANATPARVNASVQQWYGEYSLPAAVYAVPKGTDLAAYGRSNRLDEKSPIFLKNGYITVNFNIETIRNANLNSPHLQYINSPLNNQWWDMEGYDSADGVRDHVITDPYGVRFLLQDGDVLFYDANKSSYDDYRPTGTH